MMLSDGIAAFIIQVLTTLLDTAKVRLQIQGQHAQYNGMTHFIKTMLAQEGIISLYKGQILGTKINVFVSLRIGLYQSVKQFFVKKDHAWAHFYFYQNNSCLNYRNFYNFCNPTEVVKIRFRRDGKKLRQEKRYKSVTQAMQKQQKLKDKLLLWTGLDRFGPNIVRNTILNATKIANLIQQKISKDMIISRNLMQDGKLVYLVTLQLQQQRKELCLYSTVDAMKARVMKEKPGKLAAFNQIQLFFGIFACSYAWILQVRVSTINRFVRFINIRSYLKTQSLFRAIYKITIINRYINEMKILLDSYKFQKIFLSSFRDNFNQEDMTKMHLKILSFFYDNDNDEKSLNLSNLYSICLILLGIIFNTYLMLKIIKYHLFDKIRPTYFII